MRFVVAAEPLVPVALVKAQLPADGGRIDFGPVLGARTDRLPFVAIVDLQATFGRLVTVHQAHVRPIYGR